jgi:hypothetical protein
MLSFYEEVGVGVLKIEESDSESKSELESDSESESESELLCTDSTVLVLGTMGRICNNKFYGVCIGTGRGDDKFNHKRGNAVFLQNVTHVPNCTVSQSTSPQYKPSPP